MIRTKLRRSSLIALLCASFVMSPMQSASACSRAVYFGQEGQTVTGRSMDWLEDMQTNLWIFPRGIKRDGGMGDMGFKWTSKYGSVIASVYEAGTADRFARASFYINAAQQSADPREAVASVFSVMRNVSVPRGIGTPDQPNISSAIWRTVADQKNKVYYFEDTASPSLVWVRLNQIDFKLGAGVRKLTLHGNPNISGDQTANFKKTDPFVFLAPH